MLRIWICLCAVAATAAAAAQGCGNHKEGEMYPIHPDACLPDYYWCASGIQQTMTCGNGLVFNEVTGQCDWPSNVVACQSIIVEDCKDQYGNPVNGLSFTKASDCDGGYYYTCVNGSEVQEKCGNGLIYDISMQLCRYPAEVGDCKSAVVNKETTTVSTNTGETITVSSTISTSSDVFVTTGVNTLSTTDTSNITTVDTGTTDSASDITTAESGTTSSPSDITTAESGTTAAVADSTTAETETTSIAPTTQSEETSSIPLHTTADQATTTELPTTTAKSGDTYVGFVIDNTGSMGVEIDGVTEWIKDCVYPANPSCGDSPTGGWLIISFNDPMTTPVVGPTTDGQEIVDEINYFYVYGGGDCPEMAMDGIEKVANAVPDENSGCKIYLFTDATAKDEGKAGDVTTLLENKGCTLIPVLTGCCGECPSPCLTVDQEYCGAHVIDNADEATRMLEVESTYSDPDRTLFYQISELTGGNIYVLDKPRDKTEMFGFLEQELTMGFCPTTNIAGPSPGGYECERDCSAKGMCWDKSVSKCYCDGFCASDPIQPEGSQCGLEQVYCDPNVAKEVIPDENDCSSYFTCKYGILYHSTCVGEAIFSETSTSSCDYPENVPPPCGTL